MHRFNMTTFPKPVDMQDRFNTWQRTGRVIKNIRTNCDLHEHQLFHEYLLKDLLAIVEQLQIDNKVSKELIGSLRIKNAELELKLKGTEERVDTMITKSQKHEDIKKLEERYEALKIEMKEIENDLKFYRKVVEK